MFPMFFLEKIRTHINDFIMCSAKMLWEFLKSFTFYDGEPKEDQILTVQMNNTLKKKKSKMRDTKGLTGIKH